MKETCKWCGKEIVETWTSTGLTIWRVTNWRDSGVDYQGAYCRGENNPDIDAIRMDDWPHHEPK